MEVVLLTGVTGFIAKHIALRLLNAGYNVRGTLRRLDRAAEVGADVLELLGAEDQHHHQQHDQPMPDAERSHVVLLKTNL